MESENPTDDEIKSSVSFHPNEQEAVRIAKRVIAILDPHSISREQMDQDLYSGDESVDDYLRRRTQGNHRE